MTCNISSTMWGHQLNWRRLCQRFQSNSKQKKSLCSLHLCVRASSTVNKGEREAINQQLQRFVWVAHRRNRALERGEENSSPFLLIETCRRKYCSKGGVFTSSYQVKEKTQRSNDILCCACLEDGGRKVMIDSTHLWIISEVWESRREEEEDFRAGSV